jgi:IS5 family transposase
MTQKTFAEAESANKKRKTPREIFLDSIEKLIRWAKVKHPFLPIKRIFGYSKVRYRGLQKNHNRLIVLAAFTHLLRARPYLAT